MLGTLFSLHASNPDGDLEIEIISGYNLSVDNQSGSSPNAVYIGARVCNNGTNDLNGVAVFIGDHAADTPGQYPVRGHSGLDGTFSLEHQGASSDASRHIGDLAAGECVVQYWLVSYPLEDHQGKSVVLGEELDDDLWLNYDVWAKAVDAGTTLTAAETGKFYLRSQDPIANSRIWKHADNKIPAEYQAIAASINTGGGLNNVSIPGKSVQVGGLWQHVGTVKEGLDNDGDYVPDYNLFIQPVGNPLALDPHCFRLTNVYGSLVVEKNNGTLEWIPFKNRFFFDQMPVGNARVSALVFYEFLVLNGPCKGRITPYQASASGVDVERINSDYGREMNQLIGLQSPLELIHTVPQRLSTTQPSTIKIKLTNNSTQTIGIPELGAPIVIEQAMVPGILLSEGSIQKPSHFIARYSLDQKQSWVNEFPSQVGDITHIQWWSGQALAGSDSFVVSYQVLPDSSSPALSTPATHVSIGAAEPFLSQEVNLALEGSYAIDGYVFQDDGTGNGIMGNTFKDGGEYGYSQIEVALFRDHNESGELDEDDILLGTSNTNLDGKYQFHNLVDGDYIIKVNRESIPEGYFSQAAEETAIFSIEGQSVYNKHFGFFPLLSAEISFPITTAGFAAKEGAELVSVIDLVNNGDSLNGEAVLITGMEVQQNYDPNLFEFVQATPAPKDVDETTGEILWSVEPMAGQSQKNIISEFTVRKINVGNSVSTLSSVKTTAGQTFTGDFIPAILDTANVQIDEVSSINGVVWQEMPGNFLGWSGSDGFAQGDEFLGGIEIVLYGCQDITDGSLLSQSINSFKPCEHPLNGGQWVALDTVTTNQAGAYTFWDLQPGFYYAEVSTPSLPSSNFTLHGDPDEVNILCLDCDARWNAPNESLGNLNFFSGTGDLNSINFGFELSGVFCGTLWEDINGDGIKDPQEAGLAGVELEITTPDCQITGDCPTTTTDSLGRYSFQGLQDLVTYSVKVVESSLLAQGDFAPTAEPDTLIDNFFGFSLQPGKIMMGQDFGFRPLGVFQITDKIYLDWNGNLTQDLEDEGISDVRIQLYRDNDGNQELDKKTDAYVDSTETAADGSYTFIDIPQGAYIIAVDENDVDFPSYTYQVGDPDQSGAFCIDCNGQPGFVIGNGGGSGLGFAYRPTGRGQIGSKVWLDLNGDGLQEGPSETGLAGITVNLLADMNRDGVFVPLSSLETDSNGSYLFTDLAAGSYKVEVDLQDSDLPQTASNLSYMIVGEADYVAEVSNESTDLIDECTDCATSANFGFAAPASIGDMVYWDLDGDGKMDEMEEGIPGAIVCLCEGTVSDCNTGNAMAVTLSSYGTATEPAGWYQFTNLPQGTYTISVVSSTAPIFGASLTGDPGSDGFSCEEAVLLGYPNCDGQHTVELGTASQMGGIDFGFQRTGVAGGRVWLDLDADGNWDEGEKGTGNVTIAIIPPRRVNIGAGPGRAVLSKSDDQGFYRFQNLPDGMYYLSVQVPAGYALTYDGDPSMDGMTIVMIMGGEVIFVGSGPCTDCSMDIYMGVRFGGNLTLSGSVCLDDPTEDGTCVSGIDQGKQAQLSLYKYDFGWRHLGSVETGTNGDYMIPYLLSGSYMLSLGTMEMPFRLSTFTTNNAVSPADQVQVNAQSVNQEITLNTSTSNLDFAFSMSDQVDFGDLPPNFTLNSGIAYHIVGNPATNYLGATVDREPFTTSSSDAYGDDNNGDDEDGVIFVNSEYWEPGAVSEGKGGDVRVSVTGQGWLGAWIDFNKDEDFLDEGEMIIGEYVSSGVNNLDFDIPESAILTGDVYHRFRLFPEEPAVPAIAFVGGAADGEVEDGRHTFTSLPVELLEFVAEPGNQAVELSWLTVVEENASYFGVEVSLDGAFFTEADQVKAYGNRGGSYRYTHYDPEIFTSEVTRLFYRLRMVDLDGSFDYSEIRTVELTEVENEITLTVLPLENDKLHAVFSAFGEESVNLQIINTMAQVMVTEEVKVEGALNSWRQDVSRYASGVYFVQLSARDKRRNYSFIVP
jgi:hypothetical protein